MRDVHACSSKMGSRSLPISVTQAFECVVGIAESLHSVVESGQKSSCSADNANRAMSFRLLIREEEISARGKWHE